MNALVIEPAAPAATRSRTGPAAWIGRAWHVDRPLTLVGLVMIVSLAVAAVGLVVDPRVITGAPAWLKPAKFAVSISVYSFTLVWLVSFIEGHRRLVRLVSWGTAAALLGEQLLITMQVVRGTTSHFNVATTFDAVVWAAMATMIFLLWLFNVLAASLLLRQRISDPVLASALRAGLLIAVVGMAEAYLMTRPTGAQLAAARAGAGMPVVGAHSVTLADGGPGLPVLGWSTVGGDLRIGHFLGLHALQLIPLVGWLVGRLSPLWLATGARVRLVRIAAAGYLGLVLLVTWQALRGQPLLAPDGLTLGALGAGLVIMIAAAAVVITRARREPASVVP